MDPRPLSAQLHHNLITGPSRSEDRGTKPQYQKKETSGETRDQTDIFFPTGLSAGKCALRWREKVRRESVRSGGGLSALTVHYVLGSTPAHRCSRTKDSAPPAAHPSSMAPHGGLPGPSSHAILPPPKDGPLPLPSRVMTFCLPITPQLNHSFLQGCLLRTPLHHACLPCSVYLSLEALTGAVIACFHDSLMDRSAPARL